MAAALTDMADLEELSRLSPLPPGSPGSAARGRAEPLEEEEEEEEEEEAEAEAVAALLLNGGGGGGGVGGGEAETMSEPSPESASQAGEDEDEEEDDDDEEEEDESSSGGGEEESSAESLVGSSSGGSSSDETRSLSPGAASSSSGDGDGKEGLEEPKGPRGSQGGGGGGSSSSSVVSSGGDEGYGTGGGGSSATSGGRRGSLEMSSDGEPLSRMDSEDSYIFLNIFLPLLCCLLARPHDFFDAQTLDAIRHRAICFNLSAHIESLGKGHSVVFHSTVIAKRKEDSGKIKLLLHWMPEDILPDVWVNESERHQLKTKVVHLSKLPKDTALLLDPNIYRTLIRKVFNLYLSKQ
ncbi:hypothetical protein FD754_012946 [Muntiacus muntjak]|uniref:AEBP2-like C-terminal SH3 domain-containing protein n=1 Tax=Muntiacus muntjak TaxID=9888 RepID=A0A5N3VFQ0_MUNMU|nr:hypothetical protein FD754_012946 [Muntiacus muntjak]